MEITGWMSLQHTATPHSHKDSKRNPLLVNLFVWIWIHTSGNTVVNSLFVHFLDMIKNWAVRVAASPRWDSFERSLIYTVCIYPWEALCGEEEWNKTVKDKCQGCYWGTLRRAAFSHLWGASPLAGRDVSTCVQRGGWRCLWQGQRMGSGRDDGEGPGSPQPQKDPFTISIVTFNKLSSYSQCMLMSLLFFSLFTLVALPSEIQKEPLDSTRFS